MNIKGCVAMVLAGGRGERLGALTHYSPKPAVHFGDKYRIIDFTLGNCKNSGISTIGVLSQYYADDLHSYINTVYDYQLKRNGIHLLPPKKKNHAYEGTADAVFRNIEFIDRFHPENVLILAGDHIYKMDYSKMMEFHQKTGASITVAATPVSPKDVSRFGVLSSDPSGRVYCFEEKPLYPKSNLASMGVYIFQWDILKKYLLADNVNELTHHDFGRDILPEMLDNGELMYTYEFYDYWRDVGTVDSLWEANMDQLNQPSAFHLRYDEWFSADSQDNVSSYTMARGSAILRSIVSEGCSIFGKVEHSVLGPQVTVGEGAEIVDSVIMPGAYIGNHAKIYKAVVGPRAAIMDHVVIGGRRGSDFFSDQKVCSQGVSLVAPWLHIKDGLEFKGGSHIYEERLQKLTNRITLPYFEQLEIERQTSLAYH